MATCAECGQEREVPKTIVSEWECRTVGQGIDGNPYRSAWVNRSGRVVEARGLVVDCDHRGHPPGTKLKITVEFKLP